jgi:hypothetical protein
MRRTAAFAPTDLRCVAFENKNGNKFSFFDHLIIFRRHLKPAEFFYHALCPKLLKMVLLMKLFLLPLSFLFVSVVCFAQTFTSDGIKYTVMGDGTLAVVSGGSYSGDIVIPSSVTYNGTSYDVTYIGNAAFYQCTGLTSVVMPNSVTDIDQGIFAYCTGLKSVTFSSNLYYVQNYTFIGCTGLTSMVIPSTITEIGAYAFSECSGLESITLSSNLTYLGAYVFYCCEALKSIALPSKLEFIGDNCFYGCNSLTSIVIPNSVTTLDHHALCKCSNLESVTLPSGLLSLSDGLLRQNPKLKTVTIPSTVTSIGTYVFSASGGPGITSIVLPEGLRSIGEGAFTDCELTTITIPASVQSLGYKVFCGCTQLASVHVKASSPIDLSSTYGVFEGYYPSFSTLYVPVGSKAVYQQADQWDEFGSVVEEAPTGVSSPKTSGWSLSVQGGVVILSNLTVGGDPLEVYSQSGLLLEKRAVTATSMQLELPAHRFYIVRIGAKREKVIL